MLNRNIALLFGCLFVLKLSAIYFTNFNLFGDEAQYWLWSKNLDIGYFSKPPLIAWFIGGYTKIFGDGFVSIKIIPSLVYFITSISLFNLCKNIGLNRKHSLSCAVIFLFIPAVSFSSFIVSTDIFLLLFWVMSLDELVKIKKNPGIKKFIVLGILLGLAFLSKYAAIYFYICLILYILLDHDTKNIFVKNYRGFLLSFFCTIIIILPNIIWNFNNSWITLQHTSDNANFENLEINLFRGFGFLGTQLLMVGPFLFVANLANYKKIIFSENQKFLLIFSLPIFLIVFIEAVIVRANANWAAPALVTFFVFLYINTINLSSFFIKINIFFNFCFCSIFFILIALSYPASIFNRISGLNEYAQEVFIKSKESNINNLVISDRLIYASISYELRDKKLVFLMPHKQGEKVTNHFKISSPLSQEFKDNFILIGEPSSISYLKSSFIVQKKILMNNYFKKDRTSVYEISFN